MRVMLLGSVALVFTIVVRAGQPAAVTTVIDHVSVVDAAWSRVESGMRIVITGARILTVDRANAGRIPEGARVVDAAGKFVVAGLADMHNHLDTSYAMPGPGQPPRDFRRNLAQMLAWGFTTVFSTSHTETRIWSTSPR